MREVEEETGLTCRPEGELPAVHYSDRSGRPKTVRYWRMRPVAGSVAVREPDREVDRVVWLPVDEARRRMSYEADRALLAAALNQPGKGPEGGAER